MISIKHTRYYKNIGKFPMSYRRFADYALGWDGLLEKPDIALRMWSISQIEENYAGYRIDECLDINWFVFGGNGGGELYAFKLNDAKHVVYMIPIIGMSNDDAMQMDFSIDDVVAGIARHLLQGRPIAYA